MPKSEESIKVYEQQNAINKDWELERYFLPKEYALTKLKSFEVQGGDIIVLVQLEKYMKSLKMQILAL